MTGFLAGFFAPWLGYAAISGLHLALPARRVAGYAHDDKRGAPLSYRLNGPLVFSFSIALWFAAGYSGVMPWDWLWQHRWSGVSGAFALSLAITAAVVLSSPDKGHDLLSDLYLGRRVNPQMFGGRADAKMLLYLVGAVCLELNLLSFAAHHFLAYPGDPSPGVVLHVALFTWFVCDYLVFERVHLYTYDLIAERLGFKLVWGCLTWYPYFYAVGLWSVADLPNPQTPVWLLVVSALIFFAGWSLARGSNMQKFAFKRDPDRAFLGRVHPETFSDGNQSVLYSGFWGISRHVNYLGEFLMACGLALSLGWPLMLGPWLYPLYYVALLVPRERDDDRRCARKYGQLWERYRAQVPWRIVPRIY